MKIKEYPNEMRPREKAYQLGVAALSDRELLALVIRKGTNGCSVLDLADRILKKARTMSGLCRLTMAELVAFKGIKKVKAIELLALAEIAIRMMEPDSGTLVNIDNPESLAMWLNLKIGYHKQEHFLVVYLDTQNRLLHHAVLFKGTLDRSVVHPREVFKEAVRCSAARMILVHNHPGGSTTPSYNDIETTKALIFSGDMMGIFVLDHLIVSEGRYVSLRQLKPHLFDNP